MPDAGASRKRQIQVTPGPFNDATASGAVESARGAETGFNKAVLGRFSAFASRFAALDLKSRQLRFVGAHSIRSRRRGILRSIRDTDVLACSHHMNAI